MNSEIQGDVQDPLIQQLREARTVPAVLKSKLAGLRATRPDVHVLAFEGIDDKLIYFHWIKSLAPHFSYEAFVCKGKSKVLAFKRLLDRDRGDLQKNVYYFIDRDYDDRQGHMDSGNLFMTEAYSVENYLVTEAVLDELLKVELHCHAEPACRASISQLFDRLYRDFLVLTRDLNFRIFLSRRLQIEQKEKLPDRINKIAKVSLTAVEAPEVDPSTLFTLEREPLDEERDILASDFAALEPRKRYRGKFALLFFSKWLEHLSSDRNARATRLFQGLEQEGFVARGHVGLDSIAAKAVPPPGLADFVQQMMSPQVVPETL